jgi:ATP-dependent Clp protease ATP-binding subunit ClpX
MEGISLSFTETALDFIVEKAMEFRLGARGLRSICEAIVTDAMFEMPSKEDVKNLNITKPYAEEKFNKSKFTKLKVA